MTKNRSIDRPPARTTTTRRKEARILTTFEGVLPRPGIAVVLLLLTLAAAAAAEIDTTVGVRRHPATREEDLVVPAVGRQEGIPAKIRIPAVVAAAAAAAAVEEDCRRLENRLHRKTAVARLRAESEAAAVHQTGSSSSSILHIIRAIGGTASAARRSWKGAPEVRLEEEGRQRILPTAPGRMVRTRECHIRPTAPGVAETLLEREDKEAAVDTAGKEEKEERAEMAEKATRMAATETCIWIILTAVGGRDDPPFLMIPTYLIINGLHQTMRSRTTNPVLTTTMTRTKTTTNQTG